MFKSSDTRIVFNLKSSSVELLVVDFKENSQPNILFTQKEILPYQEKINSQNLKQKTFEAISRLIKNNIVDAQKFLKDCKKAEIIFYSPWFLPELILEKYEGEKASLKKIFNEKVKPPQQSDYIQIENKITSIKINGYSMEVLKDIPTDNVGINLFRSFISKETNTKIKEIIKDRVKNIHEFSFSSSTMVMFESIKNLFFDTDNFIFLNIGGEVTEIGISQRDALEFVSTVPIGTNEFARKIETFTGPQKDLASLEFLADKQTDENLSPDAQKITDLKEQWINEIQKSFKEYQGEIPRRIFISANSSSMGFIKMILNKTETLKENDLFFLDKSFLKEEVYTLDTKPLSNVEYLLTAYYLSIKK